MAMLKCKMCGGDVELAGDKTFGTCEYCGCTMTFPKVDDDQRAAAFNRGNHFRRIGEFDKALAVYERMVQEDDTDAEAHWCCALCRFGIEYVEDPATMEWLPTCHRASFDSFLEDVDYLAAVKHSAGITQRQYQKDAAKIADVQRGILATSQNAEPYDVFICYKETDENGNRTKDSTLAQEIYYQLTEQGRKVFFARITLEDVAGTQYEPYIFAALNSARVMIVVGTTAENLSAVWVKNEWSRFLSLMKKDHGKLLLPCYRDMDPYDLPEQLSVLQSYDMAKIGFIQDLTRGIAKVLDAEKKPTTVVKETIVTGGGGNVATLLKRAFMYLEDGEWEKADVFCEQVLNVDPECAEAYLAKLMAELQVKLREDLKQCAMPFDQYNNYQKAMRFGDDTFKAELKSDLLCVTERQYDHLVKSMHDATTIQEYVRIAKDFRRLTDYKDAAQLAEKCEQQVANLTTVNKRHAEEQKKKIKKFIGIVAVIAALVVICVCIRQCNGTASSIGRWSDVVSTAAGFEHSVGLRSDGTVVAAGRNDEGQCDVKDWTNIVQVAAGYAHTVGLKSDGTVVATGRNAFGCCNVEGWKDIVQIAAGGCDFTVGLKSDGTVVTAYQNIHEEYFDCDYDCSTWTDIKYIEAGYDYVLGIQSDGTVRVEVGHSDFFSDKIDQWTDIAQIDGNMYHCVGVKRDGTVVAIGDNEHGKCNVDSWADIVQVGTGYGHTVGLRADGTVVATGLNHYGQCDVSEWTDIVSISVGYYHTIGVKSDGTVLMVGADKVKEEDHF